MCGFGVVMSLHDHSVSWFRKCFIDKSQVYTNGFCHRELAKFIDNITSDLPDTDEFQFYVAKQTAFTDNQMVLAKNHFYEIRLINNDDKFTILVALSEFGTSLPECCLDSVAYDLFSVISKFYEIVI